MMCSGFAQNRKLDPAEAERLREKLREMVAERGDDRLVNPSPSPRYDAVYFEGLAWLDSLG